MRTQDYISLLERDWKQRHPEFYTPAMLCAVILARTSILISRNLAQNLEKHGLHISGFDVMVTLYRMNEPAGIPLHALSEQMAVTPASMTNRVDNLVEKGLVQRIDCPSDRRSWHICLTPAGKQLIESLIPAHSALENEQFAGLTHAEQTQLVELLLKILNKIEN